MSTSPELRQKLTWLYALERRGMKTGLEPTRRLLAACGNPQQAWDALHIAGTNGKGSTAAMLATIAREAGFTVGLYTSPHLVRFNERIRVNGRPIDNQSILDFIDRTQAAIEDLQATFFETTTALAGWYFQRKKVDLAVIETGLGGRLDSTNVLTPRLTVITPVGRDHGEILGTTLTAIAREKGGIIKPGVPVVLGPQVPYIGRLLKRLAENRGSPLYPVDLRRRRLLTQDRTGSRFRFQGQAFNVRLLGSHQVENACTALTAMQVFLPTVRPQTLARGLLKTTWPGRLERLPTDSPVYYDVAHNAHGLTRVLGTLAALYPLPPQGLMVLKGDKDIDLLAPVIRGK
ncbi:MAG: bifunctional folylpolyglutamate synthase/dihydrofolate synthase, partial [FCB group bacterium]|nr:bifunctional folylpolyglutamate synthase/dihydrofolate synthase [FCB group bacterium]